MVHVYPVVEIVTINMNNIVNVMNVVQREILLKIILINVNVN